MALRASEVVNQPLVSVDFDNFKDGSGIKLFYGSKATDSSGSYYQLVSEAIYPSSIETQGSTVVCQNPTFTKSLDLDFDIKLAAPRTLYGRAYFNCTSKALPVAGSGGESFHYVVLKIRKYSGTTETEIASVQTDTLVCALGAETVKLSSVYVDVPRTRIGAGETLRVTVEVWVSRTSTNATYTAYGVLAHDPAGRDSAIFPDNVNYTTQLKFFIPFDIDL